MYTLHASGKSAVKVTEVKNLPKTLRLLALKIKGSNRKTAHPEAKVMRGDQLLLRTVGLTVYPEYLAMTEDEWFQLHSCQYKPLWADIVVTPPSPIQVGPLTLRSGNGKDYYGSFTNVTCELHINLIEGQWVGRIDQPSCCQQHTVASTDPQSSLDETVRLLEGELRPILNESRSEWESLLIWAAQPSDHSVPTL